MLRSIFSKAPVRNVAFTSGFCTQAPRRPLREINESKIIGTLINDSFVLKSGTKALTVKTWDTPEKYTIHQVHTNTYTDFKAGQRVYVNGKLHCVSRNMDDGKYKTCSTVKTSRLEILNEENGSLEYTDSDKNVVQLLGSIASNILSKDNHSTFAVATHYTKKDNEGATNFHRVFVYDDSIREYIQNRLTKADRVLISGKLGHMTHTAENGVKLYSGFIIAENIYKIARRSNTNDAIDEES